MKTAIIILIGVIGVAFLMGFAITLANGIESVPEEEPCDCMDERNEGFQAGMEWVKNTWRPDYCPECPETPRLVYLFSPGTYMLNTALDIAIAEKVTCRWVIDDCRNCKHPTEDWVFISETITLSEGSRWSAYTDYPTCNMKWVCNETP